MVGASSSPGSPSRRSWLSRRWARGRRGGGRRQLLAGLADRAEAELGPSSSAPTRWASTCSTLAVEAVAVEHVVAFQLLAVLAVLAAVAVEAVAVQLLAVLAAVAELDVEEMG